MNKIYPFISLVMTIAMLTAGYADKRKTDGSEPAPQQKNIEQEMLQHETPDSHDDGSHDHHQHHEHDGHAH